MPGRLVLVVVVLWRGRRGLVVVGWRVRACVITPVVVVVIVVWRRLVVVVVVRAVIELTTKWFGRRGRNSSRRDGCIMESTWSRLGRRWRVDVGRGILRRRRDVVQSTRCGLWWVGRGNGSIVLWRVRRRRRYIVQCTRLGFGRRWRSILRWVGWRRIWCIMESTRSGLGRRWTVNRCILGRRRTIVQSTRSWVSLSLYSRCRRDAGQLSVLVNAS